MRHPLYLALALFAFLTGCFDSSATNATTTPSENTGGVTVTAKSTCLSKVAKNSKAFVRGTSDTFSVDANGCFEVPAGQKVATFAGRAASEEPTVVLVNDSSLFSLTIPFSMLGDTFQMVQTDLAIRRAKIGQFDSVLAIVFDKDHIKERKARMRKASNSNSVDWSLKFYSPDTGSAFLVHFEFHKGDSTWTSELVTAEPGSSFDRNVSEYSNGSVPNVDTTDILMEVGKIIPTAIKATSIYGIAKIQVDGITSDSIKSYPAGRFAHIVKVTDSAGYSSTVKIHSYLGENLVLDSSKIVSTTYDNVDIIRCKSNCIEGITELNDTLYYNGVTLNRMYISDEHYSIAYEKVIMPSYGVDTNGVRVTIQTLYYVITRYNGSKVFFY